MDKRLGATPASPAASRPENPDRPRQVIGRVPVIERRSVVRIGHFGTYYEMSYTHKRFLLLIFDTPAQQFLHGAVDKVVVLRVPDRVAGAVAPDRGDRAQSACRMRAISRSLSATVK